jgi:RNA polymerase sigma-70 factor (ECF subfamily)
MDSGKAQGRIMSIPEEAWESVLERTRPGLHLLARQRLPRRLWRRVDPSDVVQITLKEAYEKRSQFQGAEPQLLGWLRPMLVHRLIDEIRRCQAQGQDARLDVPLVRLFAQTSAQLRTELVAVGTSPSRALMKREVVDRLGRALESLPEDQRLVVDLHHLQGLKVSEVAAILELSRWSVARLLQQALGSLLEALKDVL